MTQTYPQLMKQIAELQAKAEAVKRAEVVDVIAKAKHAISFYGLTADDLFGSSTVGTKRALKTSKTKAVKTNAAKYADRKGGIWVGRGKRPLWLNERLQAGARLENFLVSKPGTATASPAGNAGTVMGDAPETSAAAPARKKRASKAGTEKKASTKVTATKSGKGKYSDGSSNSWTGMGPRPRWLKEGIAGGKKLEDFLA